MNRLEFTINIVGLLKSMIDSGEHPIIDYVKRSDEEQRNLFEAGKSKCDGFNSISQHQRGKAMDIYFPDLDDVDKDMDKNELLPPKQGWDYWHDLWESWGGQKMLDWDKGHFEG
jgi:hypothetical protein